MKKIAHIILVGILFLNCYIFIAEKALAENSRIVAVGSLDNYGDAPYSTSINGSGFSIPSVGLPSSPNGIKGIIENILLWLLAILGFIGIIGFVISGIMYLVSAGNDEAVKSAKKGMTASIIGVIVGLAGVVVIQAIEMALNGFNRGF